jgi:hypothetical protein
MYPRILVEFLLPTFLSHSLTDYEIRDPNDETNKRLQEKCHCENQIIALGGAD